MRSEPYIMMEMKRMVSLKSKECERKAKKDSRWPWQLRPGEGCRARSSGDEQLPMHLIR